MLASESGFLDFLPALLLDLLVVEDPKFKVVASKLTALAEPFLHLRNLTSLESRQELSLVSQSQGCWDCRQHCWQHR